MGGRVGGYEGRSAGGLVRTTAAQVYCMRCIMGAAIFRKTLLNTVTAALVNQPTGLLVAVIDSCQSP